MKTIHFLSAALLAAVCFANPLNNNLNAQTSMASKTITAAKHYACPHHSDKVSDKPGKCACGMDLAEVKASSKMVGEGKPMMKPDSNAMDKGKGKKMNGKVEKTPSKSMKSKSDMKKESDMKQKM